MEDSNSVNSEEISIGSKENSFWGLIKELIYFGLFLLLFAGIIGLVIYALFGLDWIFANYLIIFYLLGYPAFIGVFTIWIKLIKKKNFKAFMLGKPKMPM